MVLLSQHLRFQGKTQVLVPAVIPAVQYAVIIRDYDMRWTAEETNGVWPKGVTHVSRPTRNGAGKKAGKWIQGLPATCRAENESNVVLTERIQRWTHQKSCQRAWIPIGTDYSKSSFKSLWRNDAFASDFAGSTTHHDYINEENEDAPDMVNKVMGTSGALVKILGSSGNNWIIEAVDVRKDLGQYTVDSLHLWYEPATSRRDLPVIFGKWWREDRILPFDMYNGKTVMWWLSNDGTVMLPKSRIQLIKSIEERPPVFVL